MYFVENTERIVIYSTIATGLQVHEVRIQRRIRNTTLKRRKRKTSPTENKHAASN